MMDHSSVQYLKNSVIMIVTIYITISAAIIYLPYLYKQEEIQMWMYGQVYWCV